MTDSPLVIENLTFQYRTRPEKAIEDLSFDLKPGEMLLIAGSSGCGKTTLLRSIAGLEHPQAGEIYIDGELVFSAENWKHPIFARWKYASDWVF